MVMCAEGGRLRWRGRDNDESEIVGMAVLLATGFDGFSFLFSILLLKGLNWRTTSAMIEDFSNALRAIRVVG